MSRLPLREESGTGCWIWEGAQNGRGYGSVWANDRTGSAHRVMYEDLRGPIPGGLVIDHLCRNPRCVNPGHMEPVSQAENVRRGTAAKLNATKADFIRGCDHSARDLATRFGVSESAIYKVRQGKRWAAA